jgi:hypothetical protein
LHNCHSEKLNLLYVLHISILLPGREFISGLKKTVRNEMKSKLDVFQTNEKQIEEGLTTFDLSVTSVIKALTETMHAKILLTVYAKF